MRLARLEASCGLSEVSLGLCTRTVGGVWAGTCLSEGIALGSGRGERYVQVARARWRRGRAVTVVRGLLTASALGGEDEGGEGMERAKEGSGNKEGEREREAVDQPKRC